MPRRIVMPERCAAKQLDEVARTIPLNHRNELRSLFNNAMKCGRSPSLTAVNFRPSPHPGFTCRTTASALICPSWTRKSTLALEPTALGLAVSTNRPPRLTSRTRAVSSRSLHRQKTQTSPGVSIRELNRLEGEAVCRNRWHLRWPSHLLRPFVSRTQTPRAAPTPSKRTAMDKNAWRGARAKLVLLGA